MSLMTRKEFIAYRDKHALEQMVDRKFDYEGKAAEKLTKAKRLRKKMKAANSRDRDLIEADYNQAMKEWAAYETGIGSIERDARYIRHMKKEQR